jgi:hypothetical protein
MSHDATHSRDRLISFEDYLKAEQVRLKAIGTPNALKHAAALEGLELIGQAGSNPQPTLTVEVPVGSRVKVEAR